jgi:hypothetical protein
MSKMQNYKYVIKNINFLRYFFVKTTKYPCVTSNHMIWW